MRIAKIGVIALFLFMALGGIGGVMLRNFRRRKVSSTNQCDSQFSFRGNE